MIETLCAAERLLHLTQIEVSGGRLTARGLARLAARFGRETRVLKLAGVTGSAPELVELLDEFVQLEELGLEGFGILGPDEAIALAAAPCMRQLRSLNLTSHPIEDRGIAAIMQAAPQLEELVLCDCRIGANGAAAIASAPGAARLRVLDLSGNSLGDDGARTLASSSALAGLVEKFL